MLKLAGELYVLADYVAENRGADFVKHRDYANKEKMILKLVLHAWLVAVVGILIFVSVIAPGGILSKFAAARAHIKGSESN